MDLRTRHVDAARTRLAHLGGLAARTDQADRKIQEAAQHRLQTVLADLDSLRPRVLLDDAAAERYQDLTAERGQLDVVLGQAERQLTPPDQAFP